MTTGLSKRTTAGLAGAIIGGTLLVSALQACDVPVFRYALERWPAEPHMLLFSPGVKIAAPDGVANHLNLWVQRAPTQMTHDVSIAFPDGERVWYEGPWKPGMMNEIADSPLRRRIAQALVTGQAAFWIFLEGPQAATNDAIYARLKKTLAEAEQAIVLPQKPLYDAEGPAGETPSLGTKVPLRVAFAAERLSRDDVKERLLVRQLEAMLEPERRHGPALFAVFGQGRALPLAEDALSEDSIGAACGFLCGACSCQIKESNPGIDLLLAANWNEALSAYPQPVKTVLPGGKEFMFGGDKPLPASRGRRHVQGEEDDGMSLKIARALGGAVLLALVAVMSIVWWNHRRSHGR